MTARLFVEGVRLEAGQAVSLDENAARHAQVLRLQPGDALVVFDGRGGEWLARVQRMGRRDVDVVVEAHVPADRELSWNVTLAVGVPANDRMDALIEKATELGCAEIQPLTCARSVVRLDADRAAKKVAHWQAVAVAASEQSGRTRVPQVRPVAPLKDWLPLQEGAGGRRAVLSFQPEVGLGDWLAEAKAAAAATQGDERRLVTLSGPEGGLAPEEEALARGLGWRPIGLGARVLRADTAPLMVMSAVALLEAG